MSRGALRKARPACYSSVRDASLLQPDPLIHADRNSTSCASARSIRRPLESLLADSAFVSVHVALAPETRNLIDGRALSRLPQGAVLVNTARGGIVDEDALVEALRSGLEPLLGQLPAVIGVEPFYAFPQAVVMMTFLSFFIGIFLQLMWEELPITEPL